jgi:hypothetical protein
MFNRYIQKLENNYRLLKHGSKLSDQDKEMLSKQEGTYQETGLLRQIGKICHPGGSDR